MGYLYNINVYHCKLEQKKIKYLQIEKGSRKNGKNGKQIRLNINNWWVWGKDTIIARIY